MEETNLLLEKLLTELRAVRVQMEESNKLAVDILESL